MPARIELRHGWPVNAQRMAAIELPRHLLVLVMTGVRRVARLEYLARKRLHRRCRQDGCKLRDMRAAVCAAQAALYVSAEILQQVQPDELAVVRSDRVAMTG